MNPEPQLTTPEEQVFNRVSQHTDEVTTPEDTHLREQILSLMIEDDFPILDQTEQEKIGSIMRLITLHTEKEVKRKMDIIKMSDSYTFITGEKYYNQRMMDRATNEARIDELKQFVTELNTVSPYEPLKGTPREYVEEKAKKRFAQLTPKENK